ncbi:MAG: peptidoglycan editing factor PgeF [Methyloligellaceae bacterium]
MVDKIECEMMTTQPGVRHGFFTRNGGKSDGLYESLNCGQGSADQTSKVLENKNIVAQTLDLRPEDLRTVHQFHSAEVFTITSNDTPSGRPKADAMVTNMPNIGLGILTADCAPVLFAEPNARIIAAAHAGWKGALRGVLHQTVAKMAQLGAYPDRITATIGPTLSQVNYEVGPEFHQEFIEQSLQNACFFYQGKEDRYQFDLPGFIADSLQKAGVVNISNLGLCTYGSESDFFSYRRSVHRKENDYGRQISIIVLE